MYPQDRDEARQLARKLQGAETTQSEQAPPHAPHIYRWNPITDAATYDDGSCAPVCGCPDCAPAESEYELRRRLPLTMPATTWQHREYER